MPPPTFSQAALIDRVNNLKLWKTFDYEPTLKEYRMGSPVSEGAYLYRVIGHVAALAKAWAGTKAPPVPVLIELALAEYLGCEVGTVKTLREVVRRLEGRMRRPEELEINETLNMMLAAGRNDG